MHLNSTLLLLIGLCTWSLGQQNLLDRKVTIDFKNVSVKEALEKLKKETNASINFRSSELPENRIVTKSFEQETLRRIIKEIWGSKQLKLRASGNMISIKRTSSSPEKELKDNLSERINNDNYEYSINISSRFSVIINPNWSAANLLSSSSSLSSSS